MNKSKAKKGNPKCFIRGFIRGFFLLLRSIARTCLKLQFPRILDTKLGKKTSRPIPLQGSFMIVTVSVEHRALIQACSFTPSQSQNRLVKKESNRGNTTI